MIRLGLIGKNIQHSLSPSIYQKIYGGKVVYDLLDYQAESDIPNVRDLFNTFNGINITSPYKKHFLNTIELTPNAAALGAVNVLKKSGEKIIGDNTDFLAILDILTKWKNQYGNLSVALLGDGVMAGVTKVALKRLQIKYANFSRRITSDFNQLNLEAAVALSKHETLLVINTCSREYVFNGILPQKTLFWDYNYNFLPHQPLSDTILLYSDGREMLELQAQYAVAFWSFTPDLLNN